MRARCWFAGRPTSTRVRGAGGVRGCVAGRSATSVSPAPQIAGAAGHTDDYFTASLLNSIAADDYDPLGHLGSPAECARDDHRQRLPPDQRSGAHLRCAVSFPLALTAGATAGPAVASTGEQGAARSQRV